MNYALDAARRERNDIIILNSDVQVFEGALLEMRDVANSDHMIGFVSPRSNNATICSTPYAANFRNSSSRTAYDNYNFVKPSLSRITYAPTAVGFAMYIKCVILEEFGLFDLAFGMGYNEENDLIMRANRRGYVAAIANKAFVYHSGEASFILLDQSKLDRDRVNGQLLSARYPEYSRAVERFLASSQNLRDSSVGWSGSVSRRET